MENALFAGVLVVFLLLLGLMCWTSNYFSYTEDRIDQLEAKIDHLQWYLKSNGFPPIPPVQPRPISRTQFEGSRGGKGW